VTLDNLKGLADESLGVIVDKIVLGTDANHAKDRLKIHDAISANPQEFFRMVQEYKDFVEALDEATR
jgi:hypothetical protein